MEWLNKDRSVAQRTPEPRGVHAEMSVRRSSAHLAESATAVM